MLHAYLCLKKMKKIFFAIGFLISVYSIYFMLCVADYQLYLNDEHFYDFVLEEPMTIDELSDFARESDLVIQVREYLNIQPGGYELNIYALNINRAGWEKASLLPNNKIHIITEIPDAKKKELVSVFMVQDKNRNKVDNFLQKLQSNGHSIDEQMSDEGATSFQFNYMFNGNNAKLFSLMFILIVFSSIIYYLTRTKEIGIRKIQGWENYKIALLLNSRIIVWSLIGVLPVSALFIIYICVMNIADLMQYLYMLSLLICCLIIVNIIAIFGSSLAIRGIGTIRSIKANKNEKILLLILLTTKVVSTILFCMMIGSMLSQISDTKDMIKEAQKCRQSDFYVVETTMVDEEEVEKINGFLSNIDDDYVYNYASASQLYSRSDTKKQKTTESIEQQCEDNVIYVSYNLFDQLDLRLDQELIDNKHSESTLILSRNIVDHADEIISYLGLDKDTNVVRMTPDQWIGDLKYPGYYTYEPIVLVQPTVKGLYSTCGDIWYKKDVINDISNYLQQYNYGRSRIRVQSVNKDIDSFIGNKCVNLFEDIFMGVLVMIAFCVTSYAFIVSVVQYRKKKIAIYTLNGNRPERAIAIYLLFIMAIDIMISIGWMWQFIMIVFLELIYAHMEIHKLHKNGACRVINGE